MNPTSGGYILTRSPLVRTSGQKHTAALDCPVSQADLDALNAVQATPWRINTWLLDVLAEAAGSMWQTDSWLSKALGSLPASPGGVANLPAGSIPAMPPRLADDLWKALSKKDRKAHAEKLSKVHATRASLQGKQQALLDKLMVAQELRGEPAIWFPHTRDFRGRLYPLPVAGPHPQSDDVGKALLMFAEGKALGADGMFWLCVRAANAYGLDKLPLEERVAWAFAHQNDMLNSSGSPLENDWWQKADDPWQFLATCRELSMAWDAESPEEFVSHLPVPLDGSCNGLQHLSALGLDEVGALATNLTPGPRQDVYEDVAKRVRAKVEEDAAKGRVEALQWHGKITRDVAKRSVMTTPYGVTDRGIRHQLIQDGHVPVDGDERGPAADYLRDCLVSALSATIEGGKAIMAWLQTVAFTLAEAGQPFEWTTPTGSTVRQAYYVTVMNRIQTLCGALAIDETPDDVMLNPRKQSLAAAPNYVHSFDAAHLAVTVNACVAEGITSFAMIHDSYGTHAADTTAMGRLLRDTFVEIYREDWLMRLYDEVRALAPGVSIPKPPARGDLEIGRVVDAEFFFA